MLQLFHALFTVLFIKSLATIVGILKTWHCLKTADLITFTE